MRRGIVSRFSSERGKSLEGKKAASLLFLRRKKSGGAPYFDAAPAGRTKLKGKGNGSLISSSKRRKGKGRDRALSRSPWEKNAQKGKKRSVSTTRGEKKKEARSKRRSTTWGGGGEELEKGKGRTLLFSTLPRIAGRKGEGETTTRPFAHGIGQKDVSRWRERKGGPISSRRKRKKKSGDPEWAYAAFSSRKGKK